MLHLGTRPLLRWWVPGLFLLLAAILRLPGLGTALFMDEAFVLRGSAHLIKERTLIPPWFEWPPLMAYLMILCLGVSGLIGGWTTGLPPQDWLRIQAGLAEWQLVLPARILSLGAVLSSAGLLSFAGIRTIAGRNIGASLIGCGLFLGGGAIYRYSVWALPDALMILAMSVSLIFALQSRASATTSRIPWLVSGVLCGMAAGLKFHGGLILLTLYALSGASLRRPLPRTSQALTLGALAGFLLGAPTFLLRPDLALGGLAWLLGNLQADRYTVSPEGLPVLSSIASPLQAMSLFQSLTECIPWPGLLVAALCLPLSLLRQSALIRFKPLLIPLLATPAATLALIALSTRRDENYFFPALPPLILVLSLGIWNGLRQLFPRGPLLYVSTVILALGLVCWPVANGLVPDLPDNRQRMSDVLLKTLPNDALVLRLGGYTPKIWTPAVELEFWEGLGHNLSPQARQRVDIELVTRPRAAMTTTVAERTATPLQELQALPPGGFIVAGDLLRSRSQHTKIRPSGQGWAAVFQALDDPRQYELLNKSQAHGTQALWLYRKK